MDAIVLDTEPLKDFDGRFFLFTERYGKLIAKGTSTRKITSKLVGHLQPGFVSTVRLVERHGLRIADALKQGAVRTPAPQLYLLNQMLPEAELEHALWNILIEDDFTWPRALKLLGWDPAHAACAQCGKARPARFHIKTQEFFCAPCASQARPDELLFLHNGHGV